MPREPWLLGGILLTIGCSTTAPEDTTETLSGVDSSGLTPQTTDDSAGGTVDTTPMPTTTVDATSTTTTTTTTTNDTESSTTMEMGECGQDVTPGPTIVRTTGGAIEGEVQGGAVAFRGVRYAEPPVGERRFRPPDPRTCLPGLTPAQQFGPVCPQIHKEGQEVTIRGEEDCLTLNVWTPAADGAKRPVLVFIHGGGNATGSGSDELYDGAALAAAQDVVVVTLNYRLGALGFLVHPDLAKESGEDVSGNYGIRDQILALEWVQSNVENFGGDPGRVLVFGESAGAVNTCSLIGSPKAAGLFHRAIVQSGGCSERTLAQLGADIAEEWLVSSGCAGAADVPACLRAIPDADIVTIQPDGYPDVAALSQGWGPHVDGVVLAKPSLQAMSEGTHNAVPLVFGANAKETAKSVVQLTPAQYEALVKATFGPVLGPQVLAQYPVADYGDDGDEAYIALTSDLKFICGARRAARAADQGQDAPVFRYHFAYDAYNALPNTPKAAFHGLELVYIFGNWQAVLSGMIEYMPNAEDLAMSQRLQGAWARFAESGDPAGMDLQWPAYVGAEDNAALLDEPPGLVKGVRTEQCDFWEQVLG